MDTLRIATWNLLHPAGGELGERLETATEVLRGVGADVICLQESWQGAREHLADELGMVIHAASDGNDCAILSKLPYAATDEVELPRHGSQGNAAIVTLRSDSGRLWNIVSAHLAWGGHTEAARHLQAALIEQAAARAEESQPGSVTVLAGDFNCSPSSSTVRYLTGLDAHTDGSSTVWIDTWSYCGRGNGDGGVNGATVLPSNPLAAATALLVGIVDPAKLPDRRIDYVMVRGWVYGRPGCPNDVRVFGSELAPRYASDHEGIVVDLWDPALH
jgi:endonuclease/exonuclease/phosphatase family metal-dependent hydrolase